MSKVFVSYSRIDRDVVKDVLLQLRRAGIDVTPDDDQITFVESLGAIEQAEYVLLIWSNASAESDYVRAEVMKASHAWSEGRLILAALDQTELPPGLRDLEAIDLSIDRDQGIQRIVGLVKASLDEPRADASA
jgi:TIR domain